MVLNRQRTQSVSRQQSSKRQMRVAAACVAAMAISQVASAGTSYTFNVASGLWSDSNSWNPNSAFPVAGDAAIFTGASPENVTFSGNQSVDTVTISNTGATNFIPDATGRTLTFTGNLSIAPGSGAVTLGLSTATFTLAPSGTVSMTNNSSNLFTLSTNGPGFASMTSATPGTTVNVDGTGYTTFAGSIQGGITMNVSNGTVELAGNNTTFGGVNVSSGKLYIRSNNALGTPSVPATTLTLSGTGELGTIGGSTRTLPANISVAVTSDSVTFGDATASNSTVISGPVTFSNNAHTLNLGATVTMNGAITIPTGGLIKDGTGTLALSNSSNSWTTSTTILAGTLNCGTTAIGGNPTIILPLPMFIKTGATLGAGLAGNLTFASLNDYDSSGGGNITMGTGSADKMTVGDATSTTFSGVISGTDTNGNGEFYKVGAGTLTLKGASTFNGVMWVKEGVLAFISVRNVGSTSGSSLFQPGTTPINAVSTANNNVIDLPAGTLVSTIQLGSGTTTGTLRFVGSSLGSTDRAINLGGSTGGGVLDSSGSTIFTVAGTVTNTPELVTNVAGPGGDKTLTLTGTSTGTFSGAITETGPGTISLYKDGTNLWAIQSPASTYTGPTTVNAGTLLAQSVTALGTGSAGVTVNTNGALTFNTTNANGDFTKPITVAGPGTGTAGGGALNAGDNSNVNFTQPVTLAGDTTLLVTGLGTATYTGGITTGANNYNLLVRGGASTGGGGGNVTGSLSLGTGSLTKDQGGTWNLSGALNYSGATNVIAGSLVLSTNLTASSSVSITGGLLKLTENGSQSGVIHTGAVSVAAGQLDVTDNKLMTTTAAGTPTAGVYAAGSVQQMIHDGRNGGAWNGAGIVTSETNAQGAAALTTLATATAGDIGFGGTKTFGGQTVNPTDTLVMYTYAGDTNLDGQINGDDYFRIDQGYASVGALNGYENGDLNYDGRIDADDYFIIDSNYGNQTLGVFPSAAPLGELAGVSAVPEPASMMLLALSAGGLMRRRRRR